jgi:hypothetical protein
VHTEYVRTFAQVNIFGFHAVTADAMGSTIGPAWNPTTNQMLTS